MSRSPLQGSPMKASMISEHDETQFVFPEMPPIRCEKYMRVAYHLESYFLLENLLTDLQNYFFSVSFAEMLSFVG